MSLFQNRTHAGKLLAQNLSRYSNRADAIVLALPRGGVPVGFEVAQSLHLPLDVFIVRKLGVPGHRELAMGAIASGGARVFNSDIIHQFNIPHDVMSRVISEETDELKRREKHYRGNRHFPNLEGKTVILVDDGLATGASMKATIAAVGELHPETIIAAVPVAPADTCRAISETVDDFICLHVPEPFWGVGSWYQDFAQTTDEEVIRLLAKVRPQSNSNAPLSSSEVL